MTASTRPLLMPRILARRACSERTFDGEAGATGLEPALYPRDPVTRRTGKALTPERPPSEATFRVEHLPGDPLGGICAEPGDQTRGVVGLPPSALWHRILRIHVGKAPTRVSRAGVDRIHGDPALDEGVGQGQSGLMKSALRDGVRHFLPHRRDVLS